MTQAPACARRRMLYGAVSSALLGLAVLVLICAPTLILQAVRAGVGDVSYPVVVGSGVSLVISTVGEALLKSAVLYVLIAFTFSLLAHLERIGVRFRGAGRGRVAVHDGAAFGTGLHGEFSSYREVAPWLPSTYLWVNTPRAPSIRL